jgi:hypothetical protein
MVNNSKCPNTLSNMMKICEEFGRNIKSVIIIYSHLENFSLENAESLLSIFKELMIVDSEPNPLSVEVAENKDAVQWNLKDIFAKFSKETKSNNYAQLIKILTMQPETHKMLLSIEILEGLISNIESDDAHVSNNSNTTLESILVSDTHQDVVSMFIGEDYEEIIKILFKLIEHELPIHQVTGLRILQEIINRCGSVKKFSEQYLQDKKNLKMVMTKMLDEDVDVREGAFQLLIIYLFTPNDMKSDAVNETLHKNHKKLIECIQADLENDQTESAQKEKTEAIDWLDRIGLQGA